MMDKLKPFRRIQLTSNPKDRSLIMPYIGLSMIVLMFTIWAFAFYLLYTCGNLTRLFIIIIWIYQFTIKEPSKKCISIVQACKIQDIFKSLTVIIEEEVNQTKSIICTHPHGLLSFGMGLTLVNNLPNDNILGLGTSVLLALPISGLFARLFGIASVDNKNFVNLMSKGKNIAFVPGGFECASITDSTQDKVFIKSRKGFIKYSLMYGYTIHPVYNFNENRLYHTVNGFNAIRFLLNKIKIPAVIAYGRFLILPRNDIDVCTVIGKGLRFPTITNPSKEEIKKYHDIYLESLLALYDRYKVEFNCSETLIIL